MNRPRRLRNDALTDPRFWAMHYYMLLGSEDADSSELVEPFFGVSEKSVNDYFLSEFNDGGDSGFGYLEAHVHDGYAVQVEYAGPPDCETRFYANHAKWPNPVCLGYDSGHFALPAFRFSEANAIRLAAIGINGARSFLLMFPAVWIQMEEDLSKIRSALIAAWEQLAVVKPERLEELVARIVERQRVTVRWWEDAQLGWITDGIYSFRNPKTLMCKFVEERFTRVAEFFAAVANSSP